LRGGGGSPFSSATRQTSDSVKPKPLQRALLLFKCFEWSVSPDVPRCPRVALPLSLVLPLAWESESPPPLLGEVMALAERRRRDGGGVPWRI
jgi:hypothetical protein